MSSSPRRWAVCPRGWHPGSPYSRREFGQLARAQLGHAIHDAVQKIAVVRDDEQGAFEILQRCFQDFGRGDIQVVRRLVEEEQVRLLQHQLGELQTAALATAEIGDCFGVCSY